jgi:hypothetical protein
VADALSIVLTPVQLAAVLQGEQVSAHEIAMNRLVGGAKVLGGALELIGSAALFLAPDPTLLTKAGGGVLAVHGTDTTTAGLRQVWTGQTEKTFTQQGAEAAARGLGASPENAERAGVVVDVAVPFVVATATVAARVLAIRAGRIVLAEQEAIGGHTIARHVARTEEQLQARLVAQPGIKAASSFTSLRVAETVVSDAVRVNAAQIRAWASAASATRPLTLTYAAKNAVGYGVVRATGTLTSMSKAIVILSKTQRAGKLYFILTAYPIP